ncbi:L-threonine O-3-phosphate decarboxylase [Enhydrobacter aerosaccus]|uniref:threonine-phosphate decarboxylase n=1 Tax=Enhydrobacter aerosaccus TaxID=225324 RepID=A0A1T4NYZ9_9HYPH|nr:threonine-phosphate decarboxylase CobD [Enhydrobacter aerosaccus]SJZ84332.1 L-threonine O-3-phosphate decarboxylase [Enhydrobacter aerosaccus]
MRAVLHGGDLSAARRRHPDAPQPWLDLSTGINPVAYPVGTIAGDMWSRLPDGEQERALIAAAARRYGVAEPARLVAAPGTQALIQLLPRLVAPSRVAIVGPTYEEHQVAWRRQGHDVRIVADMADAATADVIVVVNPDNPTGRLLARTELRAPRTLLVVDEAFIDFLPATASVSGTLPPRTVVLRSFGKTYGLGGLRLGFAIAEPDLAARLRDELGPWVVSGPALAVGRTALLDNMWLQATKERLEEDGRRLDAILTAAGFKPLGGTHLFRLVEQADAPIIVQRLGEHGIHVRSFMRQPQWLRFGLPGDDAAFRRLAAALGTLAS